MTKPHPTLIEAMATWLALPVYVWQGLGVRRRTGTCAKGERESWDKLFHARQRRMNPG